jgi:hypothetical protein
MINLHKQYAPFGTQCIYVLVKGSASVLAENSEMIGDK